MKKLFTVAIVLVFLGIGVSYMWYTNALKPRDADSNVRVPITIEKGSTLNTIADLLEKNELIRSSRAFTLYARWHGKGTALQAGSFVLRPSFSVEEMIQHLQSGKGEEVIITIPEGFTVSDIDALLTKKDMIKEGVFIECAQTCDVSEFTFLPEDTSQLADRGGKVEGYLYPDTYFVVLDQFSTKNFLHRLLRTFESRVIDDLSEELTSSDRSLHEIVTMATLIEEEAATDEERPVISGILWNRYDISMGLGVDATVRYILNKPRAAITYQDLQYDSPYNTRKYRGLPPGPIANAGLESIRAALAPSETAYVYYLHDPQGRIHYAKTNEEHNVNKQKYLR